jgi:hypothetical protein
MPSHSQVLNLYRSFIREGTKFPNYSIREYILRRAKEGFRSNRSANVEEATKLVALAEKEFEVAQRQSILYGMYGRKVKNVLEIDMKFKSHSAPVSA